MQVSVKAQRVLASAFGAGGVLLAASCGARTDLGAYETVASGADAAADADAAVACTPGEFTLGRADPAVMLLLDRSGSMSTTFSSAGESRWDVLTSALAVSLPPVDQSISLGALIFPDLGTTNADSCTVASIPDFLPALGNVQHIVNRMRSAGTAGSTPTADAVQVAGAALQSIRASKTARAMVLATDGGPDCNTSLDPTTCRCLEGRCNNAMRCVDDVRTASRISDLASQGIPTYVIGIESVGDDSLSDVLDELAVAGGRPQTGAAHQYYQATSSTELSDALVAIRNQVGACTYLTTSVPNAVGTITLTFGGMTIPYDATGATGWRWSDESNGEIEFASALCVQVAAATTAPVVDVSCTPPSDASEDAASDAAASDASDGGDEAGDDGDSGDDAAD